ncbi:response regulator transcription factor [Neobacillus niacini]|uniref:response regulator transcription factor n=1 Tax=Neobacillus niacini TaxID=86668 RepID=UPI002041F41C|nr:response regulator [Neobacillus niacini]MCM3689803.1 response regulator [Neobacillus niacini]
MYKLLIVDDEPIIADSLQLLFNSIESLHLEVFAVYNAYEAIAVLKKEQIDIVLTDIQMPGMDGIELHKKICEEWKQCKTVFLTGFNDFSYAQQILRNGGSVDYVLKNEDDDVILEAVQKAINLKELENQEKARKIQNEEKVNRALPILQREFFNHLIYHPNKEVEQSKLQELEVPIYGGRPFFIALGRIYTDGNQELDINILNDYIKIKLEDSYQMFHFNYQNSKSMYLFQPKAWKDDFDACAQMDSYTEQLMKIIEKFTLSFYLYAEPITWERIHYCFYELNKKLFNSPVNVRVTLVEKEDRSEWKQTIISKEEYIVQLQTDLEVGNKNHFFELSSRIFERLIEQGNQKACEYIMVLTNIVVQYLNKYNLYHEVHLNFDDILYYSNPVNSSILEAYFYLSEKIERVFQGNKHNQEDASTLVIAKLHLYISEWLNEDLSLQTLAEYTAHSPTYLSKLYKRKTGKSLSHYITEQRMNLGKSLLINTNKKIYEIAAEIGYEQQYFIRYFKKMYGITPQQYREKAGYKLIVNQAAHN